MSEPLWFYSQDSRECGPVPLPRLIELTANGTVKPTDLVWREGMEDWTAAGKVPALFPAVPPPHSPAPPLANSPSAKSAESALNRAQGAMRSALAELARPSSRGAQWLLIAGIALAVTARGCDKLDQRNAARLAAKQAAAAQEFDDEWETKRLRVQQNIEKLTAKTPATPEDQKKIADLRTELSDMLKQQGEARKELTEGRWRDQTIAARNAKWDNAIGGYWHELLFVIGTIAFTVGLILVGFGSQGPERWIAMGMLGIVTYSLFVKGAAWMTVGP